MKAVWLVIIMVLACTGKSPAAPREVLPSGFENAKQPHISINPAGEIYIAFGQGNALYVTKSADDGKTFERPQRIGAIEKLGLGMRRGPRIAASRDTITVTAISHADGNLHAWTSSDAGRAWSAAGPVNTVPNSAREGLHGLADNGEDRIFAVWLDLRNKHTELWGSISIDGGKTWAPNRQIYRSPDLSICECCHPSVLFTPDGEIVVMWRNWLNGSRDLYRSISSDGGKTFGAAMKLGSGTWPLQACPMDGGDLATTPDGIAYVWRREQQLFLTSPEAPETLITNQGTHPVVAAGRKHIYIIWQNEGDLFWSTKAGARPIRLAENGGFAAAASSPVSGALFVTWESAGPGGPIKIAKLPAPEH